jgi:hypothetical protein
MEGQGPKHERETVIRFDEESFTATIRTASEVVYRRLLKLGYMVASESDRSATFEIPKREIKRGTAGAITTDATPTRKGALRLF